jgi:small subunit ribosomal protein S11
MADNKEAGAATEEKATKGKKGGAPKKKKKVKKNVSHGIVHIKATFNNTLITITDMQGNVISWSTAGARGFKGSKKSTPFAAQIAAEDAARKASDHGLRTAEVYITGPGSGRETALRAIGSVGIRVSRIQDVTPIPHNGCRPPKKRRV